MNKLHYMPYQKDFNVNNEIKVPSCGNKRSDRTYSSIIFYYI